MFGRTESNKSEIIVDLARNRTRVVDPRDPGRRDTGGASVVYGDDYVDITMYFHDKWIHPDDPRFRNDKEMDCWARLDLNGDESQMFPRSGKWVHYRTKALAESESVPESGLLTRSDSLMGHPEYSITPRWVLGFIGRCKRSDFRCLSEAQTNLGLGRTRRSSQAHLVRRDAAKESSASAR